MRYVYVILVLLVLAFGFYITTRWDNFTKPQERVSSTVLLEQLKDVTKMAVLEGHFSEIYDYKDYSGFDLPWFSKKALIRVKAKILVGFDLEGMSLKIDSVHHEIVVQNLPKAKILSIEHDLDYYDLTQGVFNSFSTQDYNRMNKESKEFIVNQAIKSGIIEKAQKRQKDLLEMMKISTGNLGWKLTVENPKPISN